MLNFIRKLLLRYEIASATCISKNKLFYYYLYIQQ